MSKRLFFTLVFIIGIFSSAAFAIQDDDSEERLFNPVVIKDGTNITITDAVASAFKNSPHIKRQKYNLDIAKSNVGIAKSQYFPVINAGIGFYNENNSDNVYYDRHLRDLPSVSISVNQLVYNFGKTTSYIKMEEFYKIGAEYEFMDSLCATLFTVKDKYYKVLKAKALMDLALNDISINEHIVKITNKEPDKAIALVYLQESKLNFTEAQRIYNNTVLDLTNAMYLVDNPKYNIQNTETFSINTDFDYSNDKIKINDYIPLTYDFPVENAVEIAYENSPDLQVLIATKNAMTEALKYVKKTYLPDLTANVGYGFNKNLDTLNNSLSVGVGLNSSLNIKELRHSIQGADAQLNLAQNEIDLFKKDLYYEVKRAFNNVDMCINQIPVAKQQTEDAYSVLKVIENQYKAGLQRYGDVQRARTNYINARKAYISSIADYNLALIQLEMAMHIHIVDIHHKSEHAVHHHSEELIEHLNEALGCPKSDDKNFDSNNKKHRKK